MGKCIDCGGGSVGLTSGVVHTLSCPSLYKGSDLVAPKPLAKKRAANPPQSGPDQLREQLHIILDTSFDDYDYPSPSGPISAFELAIGEILALIAASHNNLIDSLLAELKDAPLPDKYDLHKDCDHSTEQEWGNGYNDGYFEALDQVKQLLNKHRRQG